MLRATFPPLLLSLIMFAACADSGTEPTPNPDLCDSLRYPCAGRLCTTMTRPCPAAQQIACTNKVCTQGRLCLLNHVP